MDSAKNGKSSLRESWREQKGVNLNQIVKGGGCVLFCDNRMASDSG